MLIRWWWWKQFPSSSLSSYIIIDWEKDPIEMKNFLSHIIIVILVIIFMIQMMKQWIVISHYHYHCLFIPWERDTSYRYLLHWKVKSMGNHWHWETRGGVGLFSLNSCLSKSSHWHWICQQRGKTILYGLFHIPVKSTLVNSVNFTLRPFGKEKVMQHGDRFLYDENVTKMSI